MHSIGESLTYHHSAILVKNMQEAVENYAALFGAGAVSQVYSISSQLVNVCFVSTGNNTNIELVQPFAGNNAFDAYFKRGIHYYHIAYKAQNFDEATEQLVTAGYRLLNTFFSEAFNNKRCAFLLTPQGHLTEIIEA